MIVEPEQRIPDFVKAGADIISVHAEQSSTTHLHRVVYQVRAALRCAVVCCDMLRMYHVRAQQKLEAAGREPDWLSTGPFIGIDSPRSHFVCFQPRPPARTTHL